MSWWLALALAAAGAITGPLHGVVRGGGVPVPGAAVTATQGKTVARTVTDGQGSYHFAKLAAGAWTVRVTMTGFMPASRQVTVESGTPAVNFDLRLAPYTGPPVSATPPATAPPRPAAAKTPRALAINGSVNNAAASPYGQSPAFGNYRPPLGLLYNGSFGLSYDNSALDARSYSFTGQNTPKPAANDLNLFAQVGGPLLIPHLTNAGNAPNFFLGYQRQVSRTSVTTAALVPTVAERAGDLSALPGPIVDPATGQAFAGNQIPVGDLSPAALALLALYPQPNVSGGGGYNYQAPLVTNQHQDALQARLSKFFNSSNQLAGNFSFQSNRGDAANLFGFDDTTSGLGLNAGLQWRHSFTPLLRTTFSFDYSSQSSDQRPYFAGVRNVSGAAGIAGNDQSPTAWGPPALNFSGGWAALSDANPVHNRNQTFAATVAAQWNHGGHDLQFGGDVRRLQFNYRQQANPRGAFTFNGAASGNNVADFLLGIPATAALGFGNADKYLRQTDLDADVSDDWRASESLSLSLGARWEYQAPISERYGRLANLALTPGFASATTVLATSGPLMQPDHSGLQPRLGLAWRPFPASSLLIRAGYGVYYDTSVYQDIALRMAQQAPFATSLNVANTAATPLALASAFLTPAGSNPDVFAVDPNYRIGYAQTWNLSLQHDLNDGMTATVSYLGTKGTRAAQEMLPNTVPPGAVNLCPACPRGFVYLASNGNSTYESGTATLERRYRNGLAFTAAYTYAHALDDAALGGKSSSALFLAQNWRDLDAERGRSDFDQRHKLSVTAQFSTGQRWPGGRWTRGWTLTTQLTAASGLPLTPVTFLVIPGTGFTGVRPDVTGASLSAAPPGRFLNPAAFAPPPPGAWGDAGRNSINGPRQFSLNASLQREFAVGSRLQALLRIDATNLLNHVTLSNWNTVVGSPQFGLATAADPMRSLRTTLRFTF